ncbi:MAG: CRISPR-associated endonuclease Cas1 [Desulfobacterales bacterium]
MPRSEPSHDVVVKANRTVAQVPADNLERLVLVGYVSLTGSVLDFLIRNQVETVFMTPTGRFRARLALNEHRHVQRRTAQYLKLNDPDFALKIARTVVAGKIENMARLLWQAFFGLRFSGRVPGLSWGPLCPGVDKPAPDFPR